MVQRLLGELGTGQSGWQGRDCPRGLGSGLLDWWGRDCLGVWKVEHQGWREQYIKAGERKAHIRENLAEELNLQERHSASVGEGRGEGVGCHRILPTPQRAHVPVSYQKAVLPSASPLPLPSACTPELRLSAVPKGWPHHLWEADHRRGFSCPGLPAL